MAEFDESLMQRTNTSTSSPFVNLPNELIEHIITYAAALSPVSVAAIAQTCHTMRELIYGAPDHHLWREIFLTTFDDPRMADKADHTDPYKPYRSDYDAAGDAGNEHEAPFEEKLFDWCKAFCERVWALRYFERVAAPPPDAQRQVLQDERIVSPADNARAMEALVDTVRTALPSPPTVVISFLGDSEGSGTSTSTTPRQLPIFPPSPAVCTQATAGRSTAGQSSALSSEPRTIAFGYNTAKNIRWLEQATVHGYPPELTMRISGRDLPGGIHGLWDDEVENREMQAFSRMLAFTGFIPVPQPEEEVKASDKGKGKGKERATESAVDPTEGEASGSGSSSGNDAESTLEPEEDPEDALPASTEVVAEPGVIGTTLTYASATEPPPERDATPSYDGDGDNDDNANEPYEDPLPRNAKLPMTVLAQRRRARRLARMRVYNMQYLSRERHWGPYLLPASSKLKMRDAGSELDFLSPILEIFADHDAGHPNRDDDDEDGNLFEDEEEEVEMEFLPMGEGDLNDEHDHEDDHDHDHEHAHNVILQFPPEPFPPPPLPAQNELRADWTYLAGVRIVVEANLREAVRPEALAGLVWLDGLRRGSAPKAVGAGLANERGRSPSPAGSDGSGSGESMSTGTEVEGVDGWDWAGVEGDWKYVSSLMDLSTETD
ncbi:hypothetical protein EIP86_003027 [Pleurotus ostreatoroseus]|nr:hypothetical protein EIP86_003027 [Pleurotus ostreatoroseus]